MAKMNSRRKCLTYLYFRCQCVSPNLDENQDIPVMELEKHFEEEVPSAYNFLNVLGEQTKKYWNFRGNLDMQKLFRS